jgi:hypothetical protein
VAVETSAALWYLCGKIGGVVEAGIVGDIDDYLMKLTMGSKTDKSLPKAINVQTFVDQWIRTLVGSATGTMSSANTHILTGRERGFSIPNQTPPTSGRTSARTSARVRLQTDRDPELLFASSSTSNKFIFLTPTGGELVRLQIGFPSGTGIAGPMFPVSDISTIRSSVRSGVLEHSGGGITPCKQDQRTLLGFGVEQDDFSSNLHLL